MSSPTPRVHINMGRQPKERESKPLRFDTKDAFHDGQIDPEWVGRVREQIHGANYSGVKWTRSNNEQRILAGTRQHPGGDRVDVIVEDGAGTEVGTIPVGRLEAFLTSRISEGVITGSIEIPSSVPEAAE